MSIEQKPCPSASVQTGKTEFYETLQDKELKRRQRLSDAMTWLHPVDRLRKQKEIAHTDWLLVRIGVTLEESRAADAVIERNESAVLQAADNIIAIAQERLDPNAEAAALYDDATAEAAFPIIQDR